MQQDYGVGKVCPAAEIGDLEPVSLESMTGLFLVCTTVLVITLGAAVVERVVKGSQDVNSTQLDHTATEGQMLRILIHAVKGLDDRLGQLDGRSQVNEYDLGLMDNANLLQNPIQAKQDADGHVAGEVGVAMHT